MKSNPGMTRHKSHAKYLYPGCGIDFCADQDGTSPCQEAFNNGQVWRRAQRKKDPMSKSRYKIVETWRNWADFPTELRNIGHCAGGVSSACFALNHCVREDKSRWVKRLPESMLRFFARDCVEVLYALRGDGVPQTAIDALDLMVRGRVPGLISLGEQARLEAKHEWRHLKKSLALGNGCVIEFVKQIQSVVALVLDLTSDCDDSLRRSETNSKSITTKALIDSGLALVSIPYRQKGPVTSGWNLRQNSISDSSQAAHLEGMNIGLAHAYCAPVPTCAIDIDNYTTARPWLQTHGIDLKELLFTDNAVVIWSGKKYSLKLLYKLPAGTAPMVSTKINGPDDRVALEFRCATLDGKTVQDVLPPSRHPSGTEYRWIGRGNPLLLPEIPESLIELWNKLISKRAGVAGRNFALGLIMGQRPESPRQIAIIKDALSHISADCPYEVWRNIVWGIISTNWTCAEEIAEEWSRTAPNRYAEDAFWTLVNSYMPQRENQITVGTIYHHARLGGWNG